MECSSSRGITHRSGKCSSPSYPSLSMLASHNSFVSLFLSFSLPLRPLVPSLPLSPTPVALLSLFPFSSLVLPPPSTTTVPPRTLSFHPHWCCLSHLSCSLTTLSSRRRPSLKPLHLHPGHSPVVHTLPGTILLHHTCFRTPPLLPPSPLPLHEFFLPPAPS